MITHLRRALKYFIQITFIFAVAIGILMLSGMASKDIDTAFRNGWQSVWLILAAFAVMSLIYPFFGYGKRQIRANGDPSDHWKAIEEALASGEGYVIDCMIDIDEMVRPMVKAGDPIAQFLLD